MRPDTDSLAKFLAGFFAAEDVSAARPRAIGSSSRWGSDAQPSGGLDHRDLGHLHAILLFVGLTWFNSFRAMPLYMAALAFTAYGVHWFALGLARVLGGDPRPNAFMSVSFIFLSVLGIVVFFKAHDALVGGLFIGLTLVYISREWCGGEEGGKAQTTINAMPRRFPEAVDEGRHDDARGKAGEGKRCEQPLIPVTSVAIVHLPYARPCDSSLVRSRPAHSAGTGGRSFVD